MINNFSKDYLKTFAILSICSSACWVADVVSARDTVFLIRGARAGQSKVEGEIQKVTPSKVTLKNGSKSEDVPSNIIRKVTFDNQPEELSRAQDHADNGRFSDCLAELGKLTEAAKSPLVQHEIDYLRAFSSGQIALRGGNITAQKGGSAIASFVNKYKQSYRTYEATELMGKLLIAFGRADLAEKEFEKLSKASFNSYVVSGLFNRGQSQLVQGKWGPAQASFDQIKTIDANDDMTLQYKLIAHCESAKAAAQLGNVDAAISQINEIIKKESAENEQLFARAFNALGACYEKKGDLKEARNSYLKTELLFSSQPEPHAEALFKLANIWPQLNENERANRARSTLKSRYRNSFWATKL